MKLKDEPEEEDEDATEPGTNTVCKHCGNHPCWSSVLEPSFLSIVDTYRDWKTHKQLRFLMYSDAIKTIYGPGLGKGNRRKMHQCVQELIHTLAPDIKYKGFMESKEMINK